MQIWLGVENFAKIESARICIDRYTLLVGQNNSGKTFLMQLIQGVTEKLASLIDEDMKDILFDKSMGEYDSYILSHKNIVQFTDYLNNKLHKEKNSIVKEIFGKNIPIGKLYIDIAMTEDVFYIIYILDALKDYTECTEKIVNGEFITDFGRLFSQKHLDKVFVLNRVESNKGIFQTILAGAAASDRYALAAAARGMVNYDINLNGLFLPASRTGLLLLYREFFVNKTDNAVSYEIGGGHTFKNNELYGGLTKPIYEFLRFLQLYSESKDEKKAFNEELQFFEDHVIEGHINIDNQRLFYYHSKSDDNETPMYLASSMINETAPIAMAVMSQKHYQRLIIDEIEASLHPEKQLELVRFLNRIYRKGMCLIVSTHSDTFVSKMNNLYILSHYKEQLYGKAAESYDNKIANELEKLGLNLDDLIDTADLYVYEFVIQPNGKSVVNEIRGQQKTGFEFDLFTDSAMKIYDENLKIGELQL